MQSDRNHGAALRIKQAAQFSVSAALTLFLAMHALWASAAHDLARLPLWVALATLLILVLGLFAGTWSWTSALRLHWLQFPFSFLFRALSSCFVFNSVLPTTVPNAGSRIAQARPLHETAQLRAHAALLLDRTLGSIVLLMLGGLSAFALYKDFTAARLYVNALSVVLVIGVIVVTAFASDWFEHAFARWRRSETVAALLESERVIGSRGRYWMPLLCGSLISRMLAIGAVYVLFFAMDHTVTLAQCTMIVAVAGLCAILPVSYKGIGVMEGAFAGIAVALGLDFTDALVVALLHRTLSVLVGVSAGALGEHLTPGASALPLKRQTFNNELAPEAAVPLTSASQVDPHGRPWLSTELLEFTHDAIIIWEMDGAGILYWNHAAEQLYGYTRHEVYGKTTHSLLKTQLAGGIQELEAKIARYGVWVGELRHVARDGQPVQVEGRLALMSKRDGRWLVLEVNRNITDYKQAEIAQKRAELQLANLHALQNHRR